MAAIDSPQVVTEQIDSFATAPATLQDAEFHRLVDALWRGGTATELAAPAVPELIARFDQLDDERKGHLAILLGLLVESEYPATDARLATAVRNGMARYLAAWRGTRRGQPLCLALQYLLSHFPADREQIIAVAAELRLYEDDMSRLERALSSLDRGKPVIGRVFPYPAAWQLDESELEYDRAWIDSLTPAQIERQWHGDSRTIFGYSGAKAYWALRNGVPTPPAPDSVPPRYPRPLDADVAIFGRHAAAFRCPHCGGALAFREGSAGCASCSGSYSIRRGILDLTARLTDDGEHGDRLLFQLAQMSSMGYFVEAFARPNFKRLCGFTWDGPVTPSYEAALIAEHVRPVDGPVLDIAAGAGGWTKPLADAVGAERVIALDLVPAMLACLRDRLPQVPAVVANARTLPLRDESLGAAMCWNGPQAFLPDTEAVISEVGRCLRPGGTFTVYTFRNSDDPVYRYFVGLHQFPQHESGLRLYDLDEFKRWLDEAGLVVRSEQHLGLAVFLTAVKS